MLQNMQSWYQHSESKTLFFLVSATLSMFFDQPPPPKNLAKRSSLYTVIFEKMPPQSLDLHEDYAPVSVNPQPTHG